MSNPLRVNRFGRAEFGVREHQALQSTLRRQLAPEMVSQRQGPGGQRLAYIEGWRLVSLANEVFGFNGWSHSVTQQTIDFIDVVDEKYNVGVSATVRVELKDGVYHEDIGYGVSEGMKSKALSLEKARKEAATDGLKRALKAFGNVLGNCLNDKNYLRWVSRCNAPNPPNPDLKETVNANIPSEVHESRYDAMEERQTSSAKENREIKKEAPIKIKEEVITQPSPKPESSKNVHDKPPLAEGGNTKTETDVAKLERKRRQQQKREEFLEQLKKRKSDVTPSVRESESSPLVPEDDDESWLRFVDCDPAFIAEGSSVATDLKQPRK